MVAEERGGEVRYRQLETVRQYGWKRLQEAGELEASRRLHRDWLLTVAEESKRRSWGADQVTAFDWFELELDNLRAAIEWCEIDGAAELGLRLGATLWRFWHTRGHRGDGRVWLTRLLSLAGPGADAQARGRILWEVGLLAFWAGDTEAAATAWQESLRLGRAAGDPILVAVTAGNLAMLEQLRNNGQASDAMLAALLTEPEIVSSAPARLQALYYRGYLAINRGDLALGESLLEEGFTLGRAYGDAFGLSHFTGTLGHAALLRDDRERAREYLCETLRLRRSQQAPATLAFTIEKLGWLAARIGEAHQAGQLLGAAAEIRDRAGSELYPYEISGHQQAERAARNALGNARFETAYVAGRALSIARAVELALRTGGQPVAPRRSTRKRAPGHLSPRGWQIARLVARGLTDRQVAEQLVLQETTVGNHLQRIYARLGLNGRVQLTAWLAAHERDANPRP